MKFVDPNDPQNFAKAIDAKTKRPFLRNRVAIPALDVADLEAVAEIAHDHGLPADRGQHLHHALPDAAPSSTARTSLCTR